MLFEAHQYVLRLEIAVNVPALVHVLASGYQLVGEEKNSFKREFLSAVREQVLQRRSEHLYHHDVVVALLTRPDEFGKAGLTIDFFEKLRLLENLRAPDIGRLKFNGNFLSSICINGMIDLAEGARPNFMI